MRRVFMHPTDNRSYIVKDTDGKLYVLAKTPATPETWGKKVPYSGPVPVRAQELSPSILSPYIHG